MLGCATCKAKYNVGKSVSGFTGMHTSVAVRPKGLIGISRCHLRTQQRKMFFLMRESRDKWEEGNKQRRVALSHNHGMCV